MKPSTIFLVLFGALWCVVLFAGCGRAQLEVPPDIGASSDAAAAEPAADVVGSDAGGGPLALEVWP